MAALEPDRLVVRVVYAGAPMAGKTATVRALMPLLKGPDAERLVTSPAEHRGRTAFFDWADYEGGAFEGRPIHCQIASAPGQVALSDRRELLIRGADAVILVVDSQSDAIERTLQCYEEMAPWLADAGREAPIRVLLQCNKQDLPGSLGAAELSRALGLLFGRDVYATSARTTKGLRAAFVAGVRAAVERARFMLERGVIASAPEISSADELLQRMQRDSADQASLPERSSPGRRTRAPTLERASPAVSSAVAARPAARREETARPERRTTSATTHSTRAIHERARAAAPRARSRRTTNEPRLRTDDSARAVPPPERPARARPGADEQEPSDPRQPESRHEEAREQPPPRASASAARAVAPSPSSRPAARDWTPGSGPRPAVMPASAFYALVGPPVSRAEEEAWGIPEAGPGARPETLPSRDMRTQAASEREPKRARASEVEVGRARPAVMPASAYFAQQAGVIAGAEARPVDRSPVSVSESAAAETSADAPAPSVAALTGPKRPAVMPASAYYALLRRLELESAAAASKPVARADHEAAHPPAPEPAPEAPRTPEIPPPAADVREAIHLVRPAVLPMAAWVSGQWTSRASAARSAAPRSRPLQAKPTNGRRPAVMPASAWRAMLEAALAAAASVESPAPLAAAANDDAPSPESGFVSRSFDAAAVTEELVGVPRLPGHVVPRSTWPRSTWRQLAPLVTTPGLPRRDLYGRFIAEIAPGWYARSLESAPDLRSARRCLARAVLRQRSLGAYLSGPRCLALTEEPDRFWIWQIVYRVPTLAVQLGRLLDSGEEPSAVADMLLQVASGYLEAREKFAAAPEPLPLSLQALSAQEGKLVYAGLLPKSDSILPPPAGDGGAALEEALRRKWPGTLSPAIDAGAVIAELQRKAVGRLPDPIVEIIRGVLIRH